MKITENIFILWVFLVIGFVLVLIFFALDVYELEILIAGIIVALVLTFAITNAYAARRNGRIIAQMTDELKEILSNTDEKSYNHYPYAAKEYYQALTEVKAALQKRESTRKEILDIIHSVALNMSLESFLEETMPKLLEITSSSSCAFYTVNASRLILKHSMGFGKSLYNEFDLNLGEGLVGSNALEKGITIAYDIPDDTIYLVRTFLGKIKPRCLMTVPVMHEEELKGILVLVSMRSYTKEDRDLAELIKYYVGVAVGNGINMEKSKRLTGELTFQNKLIQDQYSDLVGRLNEKENLMNQLLRDIAYIIDKNGLVICWGKQAEEVYGLQSAQAAERHISNIHDSLKWPSVYSSIKDLEPGAQMDYVLKVSDERHINMRFAHMLDENGKSLGITVIFV